MDEGKTITANEDVLNVMADVSVQNERINGWIPSSATNVIMNWPERIKTQPHDDRDNCFLPFDSKGPCGMTVNNDIDDDSATKHGDSHTARYLFRSSELIRCGQDAFTLITISFIFLESDHTHLVFLFDADPHLEPLSTHRLILLCIVTLSI